MEAKVGEQTSLISELKLELEKVRKGFGGAAKEQERLQTELDTCKAKAHDLERSERLVRVDLEQSSKRVTVVLESVCRQTELHALQIHGSKFDCTNIRTLRNTLFVIALCMVFHLFELFADRWSGSAVVSCR